jgi:head-tail adaptor
VTIYDPNTSQTNSGYPAESESAISGGSDLPAWVYGIGGGEPLRDQQVEANITHIVELRYLDGVKQEQHVKWGTRRLNIQKLIDVNGRQRYWILHCMELGN